MDNREYSRRRFINRCVGAGSLFFTGIALSISGCDSKKSAAAEEEKGTAGKGSCDDLSGVSKVELEKRKTFSYVDKSALPGSFCGNCSLFIPRAADPECGGCMLFGGPVRAAGHCIQYVAKV